MPTNKLTDHKCKAVKPGAKPIKFFDGAGLYLNVSPTGAKTWRMAYRLGGKPQTATFGPYPVLSLADARARRDAFKRELLLGAPKTRTITLAKACRTYWDSRKDLSASYVMNATNALEHHVTPDLGERDIAGLTRTDVLDCLKKMDAKGLHSYVRKTRMWLSQVFEWAVEHEYRQDNPCSTIRPEKAFTKMPVESFAALALPEVPAFMQRLSLEGELDSAIACRLLALTWVRTVELRMMRWDEISGSLWTIPKGRMKRRREHVVPLSTQALKLLAVMRARNPNGYVFPGARTKDRPMSENAILFLIGRIGYAGKMTGHGWRSIGSTWANERGYSPDAIERQLSHAPDDKTRAVYLRSEFMPERTRMLQDWAQWLEECERPPA